MADPRLVYIGKSRELRGVGRVFFPGMLGDPSMFDEIALRLGGPGPSMGVHLPGHGPRPWGRELDTWDEVIEALARLLPSGGAHLVGYSMGARLALGLACVAPDRVLSVVAVGASLGTVEPGPRAQRRRLDLARAAEITRAGLPGFVARWEALPVFSTQARLPISVLDEQRSRRLAHTGAGIAWAFAVLGQGAMPPLVPPLRRSRSQISLVVGARDPDRITDARALEAVRPETRVFIVPEAGHNVVLEAPCAVAHIIGSVAGAPAGREILEGQTT